MQINAAKYTTENYAIWQICFKTDIIFPQGQVLPTQITQPPHSIDPFLFIVIAEKQLLQA